MTPTVIPTTSPSPPRKASPPRRVEAGNVSFVEEMHAGDVAMQEFDEPIPAGAMGFVAGPPAGSVSSVSFEYSKLENMPDKMRSKLREIDGDNNGRISLEELVALAQRHRRLKWVVLGLAVVIVLLLAGVFGTSWAAAILAQDTSTDNGAMTVKGSNKIVRTAQAEDTFPLRYAPLLDGAALANVKQISLTNLKQISLTMPPEATTGYGDPADDMVPRLPLPTEYSLRVMSAVPINETSTNFYGAQATVRVHLGEVFLENVPGLSGLSFRACGTAISDSFAVPGIDTSGFEVKAGSLGFVTRRAGGC